MKAKTVKLASNGYGLCLGMEKSMLRLRLVIIRN
jgi:hypothetical protein